MAISPQVLESIRNPTGGKLAQMGQSYYGAKQRGVENVRNAEADKQAKTKFQQEQMIVGAKVVNAYANSALDWKDANPNSSDEEFADYQLTTWNSLDDVQKELVPQSFQTPEQLTMGKVKTENMLRAFEPENWKEKAPKDPWGKINPSQYTQESVKKFEETGVKGDLVAKEKGPLVQNIIGSGETAYSKERLKAEATRIDENTKSAESAYNNIQSLKRFKDASKEGFQGGLQPILTGARNLVASFGYESEKLKDVRYMEQAIGEIQAQFMKELGARGLTDKDMEILARSLPRVETDKAARDAVADILIKTNERKIDEWEFQMDEERRIFPDLSNKIRQPYWHSLYKDERNNSDVLNRADEILRESKDAQ